MDNRPQKAMCLLMTVTGCVFCGGSVVDAVNVRGSADGVMFGLFMVWSGMLGFDLYVLLGRRDSG